MPLRPDRLDPIAANPGLSRRRFLRGLGACVALPALASLRPSGALAAPAGPMLATAPSGAPLRAAFVFFPNGAIPGTWWPEREGRGADLALSRTLQPLEPVRDLVQVLGGLDHKTAVAGPDGAGDHARGNGTFLTGVRLNKSATDIRAGVSIDQEIARRIGHLTRFPSLELSCEPARKSGSCDSGYSCAYQFNLSWSSPTTPLAPESNPRLAFERLFGEGPPGERNASLQRRRAEQRSVLDFVMDEARSMRRRLDADDRHKLDQYLTGVREIEQRIEQAERFGPVQDPGIDTPPGVPPDFAEYVRLMYDMMLLAFQTDSTRVATFLLSHDGSNRSFDFIGIPEGHHDLSHHQNKQEWMDKLADIDRWYVQQFAGFLARLRDTPDADGNSLLHNCMIVYGSGNADSNRHTHDNLPVLLAGGGGGTLTAGRYVNHRSQPMTNLFLSMADRMGLTDLERFGDSTGRLGDL
ncbi:DUF1552 domain-containing protein [Tautonia sociabilis]|uniref:DUF1552 domain-containing protein n=1 Tax=Tautonia sociabilis TaxID=2080755 RepID=A0A432MG67_9BACT|nr:DUF1552 domain-containing protein [Tautonia sociabilis]RUL85597.1 DUF1552 domain-containing protein [Tautonia sociabilis]